MGFSAEWSNLWLPDYLEVPIGPAEMESNSCLVRGLVVGRACRLENAGKRFGVREPSSASNAVRPVRGKGEGPA